MSKSKKIFYEEIAPLYFVQGMPTVSGIRNKKLKKVLTKELKKRRILQIQHKYKNKRIKNLKKKSLSQLEKLLKNSSHRRKTKKSRFSKKRKTRKLSKK